MQFGVYIFPTDKTIQPIELAKQVEARGFESLWFPEHSHIPISRDTPWGGVDGADPLPEQYWRTHDQFVALAAAAAVTDTLKLGTGITLVAQRDPLWLAKQVASLDVISNGRVLFGVGYGWNKDRPAIIISSEEDASGGIWGGMDAVGEFVGETVGGGVNWVAEGVGRGVEWVAMKAGAFDRAAQLFLKVSRGDLAAEALERAGDRPGAARLRGEYLAAKGEDAAAVERWSHRLGFGRAGWAEGRSSTWGRMRCLTWLPRLAA